MKKALIAILLLALILSITGCSSDKYTKDMYDKVQMGMSYNDVKQIFGEGNEMSRQELSGISTVMYSWQNKNGSNVLIMIQNGEVVNKTQVGLK